MSRLIWIYAFCKSLLLLLVAVKELKERICSQRGSKFFPLRTAQYKYFLTHLKHMRNERNERYAYASCSYIGYPEDTFSHAAVQLICIFKVWFVCNLASWLGVLVILIQQRHNTPL